MQLETANLFAHRTNQTGRQGFLIERKSSHDVSDPSTRSQCRHFSPLPRSRHDHGFSTDRVLLLPSNNERLIKFFLSPIVIRVSHSRSCYSCPAVRERRNKPNNLSLPASSSSSSSIHNCMRACMNMKMRNICIRDAALRVIVGHAKETVINREANTVFC